ncbi:MAG: hypothetical protein J7619_12325 [Dyadobacter sp.]|nr:hypothetical protein [Dyadobacter sp.]
MLSRYEAGSGLDIRRFLATSASDDRLVASLPGVAFLYFSLLSDAFEVVRISNSPTV